MRTLSAAQEVLYALDDRQVVLKVEIRDGGGTLRDMRTYKGNNWIVEAEWGEDDDAQVATATVTLWRSNYDDSLAPLKEQSRLNLVAGVYDPILKVGRDIIIYTAVLPVDAPEASAVFEEQFRGRIDKIDPAKEEVRLDCRDEGGYLQDTFIEVTDAYSLTDTAVEDIMQEILDDELGGGAPTLYVPASPSWMITAFETTQQGILDQLLLLSNMIGWHLRYRWDSGTSASRLTFYEPPRDKTTPDRVFTPRQYYDVKTMDVAIDDVRNRVTVRYQTGNDTNGDAIVADFLATDPASEADYGPRWMGVQEAYSSIIDTETEAQRLAEAALWDLSQPLNYHEIEAPYCHFVQLGDLYTFTADGEHADIDLDLAVVSYRHRVNADEAVTTISSFGPRVTGARTTWTNNSAIVAETGANLFHGVQKGIGTSLSGVIPTIDHFNDDGIASDLGTLVVTIPAPRGLSPLVPRK